MHLHTEYLYNTDWQVVAVRLQCDISGGTFPSFSWLHDDALLLQRDCSAFSTGQCHVLFLTELTSVTSGYYQCLVKDSFDNDSSWVQSDKVLVEALGEEK